MFPVSAYNSDSKLKVEMKNQSTKQTPKTLISNNASLFNWKLPSLFQA
jgi:hypothetical protein